MQDHPADGQRRLSQFVVCLLEAALGGNFELLTPRRIIAGRKIKSA